MTDAVLVLVLLPALDLEFQSKICIYLGREKASDGFPIDGAHPQHSHFHIYFNRLLVERRDNIDTGTAVIFRESHFQLHSSTEVKVV
jgi:hypothetical protein